MSSIQKQKSDLESIESIQMITRVMRDMSANRIKDLKDSFEKNFEFYKSVGFAFNSIKQLIYQYHTDLAESLKDRPTAHIAITSNHQFYGDLNRRIAETFLKN
jgi:F0F1-type ATP synthase gamma subunit